MRVSCLGLVIPFRYAAAVSLIMLTWALGQKELGYAAQES